MMKKDGWDGMYDRRSNREKKKTWIDRWPYAYTNDGGMSVIKLRTSFTKFPNGKWPQSNLGNERGNV